MHPLGCGFRHYIFAEGIPYFIVNSISVTMFTKMGVPNGEMALFTSLLYLPWTSNHYGARLLIILKTKRWWILCMQLLMTAVFVLTTLSIPHPDKATIAAGSTPISLFTFTLILFVITAFARQHMTLLQMDSTCWRSISNNRASLLVSEARSIACHQSLVKVFWCI